ncbi:DUF4097 family beta strand repeat-containing protein [Alteromonadaceae bacterium BrNp21-10]|nr:DUF4097 family beta strand repeat-containing protein [Alteromonadaceae bacterium BrNp21-10]
MKKLMLTIGCCLFSLHLMAAQQVDETIDADAQGYVEIKNTSGEITVKIWEKTQVRVVGRLDELAEKLIFERNGNQILIQVKVPKNSHSHNYRKENGDDLTVYLPAQSHVSYTSVNSDFIANDYSGGTDISLVNGDVSLSNLQGRIKVNIVNGDIRSRGLIGDITLETVNGDINDSKSAGTRLALQTVNGDMQSNSSIADVVLESVNGDMKVGLSAVKNAEVKTVNGEVRLNMGLMENAEVHANSVSGRIYLGFVGKVSARFNVEAHAGGNIINDLTDDQVQRNKYGPRRWLSFNVGDGAARVEVSTVSGKVTLDKK